MGTRKPEQLTANIGGYAAHTAIADACSMVELKLCRSVILGY